MVAALMSCHYRASQTAILWQISMALQRLAGAVAISETSR